MTLPLPLILAQADYEQLESTFMGRLEEGLMLMVVGMLVVFTALALIGLLLALLGRVLRERPTAVQPAAARSMETPAFAAPPRPAEMDPVLLAAIAAAAAVVAGGPVRVRRITRVHQAGGSAWTDAGRLGLQTSHSLRR